MVRPRKKKKTNKRTTKRNKHNKRNLEWHQILNSVSFPSKHFEKGCIYLRATNSIDTEMSSFALKQSDCQWDENISCHSGVHFVALVIELSLQHEEQHWSGRLVWCAVGADGKDGKWRGRLERAIINKVPIWPMR